MNIYHENESLRNGDREVDHNTLVHHTTMPQRKLDFTTLTNELSSLMFNLNINETIK